MAVWGGFLTRSVMECLECPAREVPALLRAPKTGSYLPVHHPELQTVPSVLPWLRLRSPRACVRRMGCGVRVFWDCRHILWWGAACGSVCRPCKLEAVVGGLGFGQHCMNTSALGLCRGSWVRCSCMHACCLCSFVMCCVGSGPTTAVVCVDSRKLLCSHQM